MQTRVTELKSGDVSPIIIIVVYTFVIIVTILTMTSTNPRLVIPSLEEVLKKDSQREIKKFTVVGHTDPFLPPAPGDFQLQEETQNEFIGM